MADPSVWLITGTTSGMGAAMMEQFAARADKVIATGRSASTRLADKKSENIFPLDLDATAPLSVVKEQIEKAINAFGHNDFVVNNAGLSFPQSIEEADDAFTSKLLDTNLVGAIRLVQAVLPHFRERKARTFAFIGAGLGWESYPFRTHYATAKAGLSMFVECLQKETAHLGIKAVIFESGAFVTGMEQARTAADVGVGGAPSIPDYQPFFNEVWGQFVQIISQSSPSTVEKVPPAVWDVVKSEGMASGKPFPIRVPLGLDALAGIRQKCHEQLRLCDEWEQVALSTTKEGASPTASPCLMEKLSILNLTKST
ncbi:short-chain oxidoreductase [Colletotrichum truncatum]|uniref:Short-chain oxidoreductase n=1 Tax=Colletotrichum truncatum TaxID=5467 RepID=A0ACC3Z869_COLTU|nr:short-chain oxidoreductase [Colletotrichum truncatum]XP_036580925.1 short-chain oxidoreductase [Colletotrichum truncatum]KAF6783620.1 short-chain oxidoreductase [Colletotrichum truncatum]KAF6789098.1 short-chain oxidoreductase [Colletotrichum truncatum]